MGYIGVEFGFGWNGKWFRVEGHFVLLDGEGGDVLN